MIIYCSECGAQNFIGPERMKVVKEHPPLCWVCQKTLPVGGETGEAKPESNICQSKMRRHGDRNGKN